MRSSILILVASALMAVSVARPMPTDTDVHSTLLEVDQVAPVSKDPSAEAFMVTVQRVDDIVSGDNKVLAERVATVQLAFDVVEGQLMCNSVAVPVGFSNVEMQAQIAEYSTSKEQLDKVEHEFDTGLLSVDFDVRVEEVQRDGVAVRRLLIAEKIVELDGNVVTQTDAVEEIIEIYADGTFCRNPPSTVAAPQSQAAQLDQPQLQQPVNGMDCPGFMAKFSRWFGSLSAVAQGTLLGAYAVFILALVWALAQNVMEYFNSKKRARNAAMYTPVDRSAFKPLKSSPREKVMSETTVLFESSDE